MVRRTRSGISRFRVRPFKPPRHDGAKMDKTKRPAAKPVLSLQRTTPLLRRALGGVGGTIDRFLRGVFGVAHGLLALALHFLDHAFALQAIGTGGFTDALLGLADGLVGGAL